MIRLFVYGSLKQVFHNAVEPSSARFPGEYTIGAELSNSHTVRASTIRSGAVIDE